MDIFLFILPMLAGAGFCAHMAHRNANNTFACFSWLLLAVFTLALLFVGGMDLIAPTI